MIRAIFAILAAAFGFLTCGYFAVREITQGNWSIAAIYSVLGVWIVYKQLRLDTLDKESQAGGRIAVKNE